MTATFKTLDGPRIAKRQQDVTYVELLQFEQAHRSAVQKIRIQLRSDSYRDQCHAWLERWDGAQWQEVVSLDAYAMETPEGLIYKRLGDSALLASFGADRDTLLAMAREVLRG